MYENVNLNARQGRAKVIQECINLLIKGTSINVKIIAVPTRPLFDKDQLSRFQTIMLLGSIK